jgi:hypothetical protein
MPVTPYNREGAVAYAHTWANTRNPRYYDYEDIGGDCTNFASQCVYAGNAVMNYTPDLGWYYNNANDHSPSWTAVTYLHSFLIYNRGVGPFAEETSMENILPGDLVQLKFERGIFQHTPVVVQVGYPATPDNILVAAHTYNCDMRPLSTFGHSAARFLHIIGIRR